MIVVMGDNKKRYVRTFVLDPPPEEALPDIFGSIHSNLSSMLHGATYLGNTDLDYTPPTKKARIDGYDPPSTSTINARVTPFQTTLLLGRTGPHGEDIGPPDGGDDEDGDDERRGEDKREIGGGDGDKKWIGDWYETPEIEEMQIEHKSLKDKILEGFCGLVSSVVTPENLSALGSSLFA